MVRTPGELESRGISLTSLASDARSIKPAGLRQWVAGDYVVRYFVDDDVLTIARIWHGRTAAVVLVERRIRWKTCYGVTPINAASFSVVSRTTSAGAFSISVACRAFQSSERIS